MEVHSLGMGKVKGSIPFFSLKERFRMKRKQIIKMSLQVAKTEIKKVCVACNGSGYYDHCIKGKIPKCGSCNGTGFDE